MDDLTRRDTDRKTASIAGVNDPERNISTAGSNEKHIQERDGNNPVDCKRDANGLPLVPQPSRFKDDPLVSILQSNCPNAQCCHKPRREPGTNSESLQNWPSWLKWAVLVQVGMMAFLGPYNAALINPSLVLLSKAMKVDAKIAAYSTTTGIIMGGISPFFWTPLTNYYGRRPITLLAILITLLGGVGSGASPNFDALLGTRAMCGFGFGGMMSVGTACVNDMFFLHERGEKTGVYSIFIVNGAHVAALSEYFAPQLTYNTSGPDIISSRWIPWSSSWLAMGLLSRRTLNCSLFRSRFVPIPRNTLFSRPRVPQQSNSRKNIHANALFFPRQHDTRPQTTLIRLPSVFQDASISLHYISILVLHLGLDFYQCDARH